MTDRELLEAAARAAGLSLKWGEVFDVGGTEVDCTDLACTDDGVPWNPLTDDGDAFRLAVKLRIDVFQSREDVEAIAYQHQDNDVFPFGIEPHGTDPLAATRRAIVRAAAAMVPPAPEE